MHNTEKLNTVRNSNHAEPNSSLNVAGILQLGARSNIQLIFTHPSVDQQIKQLKQTFANLSAGNQKDLLSELETMIPKNSIDRLRERAREIILSYYTPEELRNLALAAGEYKRKQKTHMRISPTDLTEAEFDGTFQLFDTINSQDPNQEQLETFKLKINELIVKLYNAQQLRLLSTEVVNVKREKIIKLRDKLLAEGPLDTNCYNKKFIDLSEQEKEKILKAVDYLEKKDRLTRSEASKLKENPHNRFSIQIRGWFKCKDKTCKLGCNNDIPGHHPTQVIYYKNDSGRASNVSIPEEFYISIPNLLE